MLPHLGCDISSIFAIKLRNENHRLAQRILSSDELELYHNFNPTRQTEFLAGRFCAKEAIIKANNSNLMMNQISIVLIHDELIVKGTPTLCKVSISHFNDQVMAVAICE